MTYKFLENVAIADAAFEAESNTLNGLFEDCAKATFEIMVPDLKQVDDKEAKDIEIEEESVDKLLYSFLEELIYLKDAEAMLFSKFELNVTKNKVSGIVYGEGINPKKHVLGSDVKAVTLHKFKVWKEGLKWKAIVVLDI
ncbi:MAG TPA: archease [Candidatus Nanoarchaeia archaeon]|nr:archease [Candidatus Nanoarchaeia archaeon]